ncbi:MAG: AI-2E family transporter [Evtepia sp.]
MKIPKKEVLLYTSILLSGFAIAVILSLLSSHMGGVSSTMDGIIVALRPIFIGMLMAYLIYPLVNYLENVLKTRGLRQKTARFSSVAFATVTLLALVLLLCYFVLPQLTYNISTLVGNLPDMLHDFTQNAELFLESHGHSADIVTDMLAKSNQYLNHWLQNDLMSTLASLASGIYSMAKLLFNLVVGLMVMVYLLMTRDHFIGQGKKILYAACKTRSTCTTILGTLRDINKIFSGFITGKLIDSLIIGLICCLVLSIVKMPYTLLISVIVGCTNIIPIFGPFIGAIPCAFLLLLESPSQCLIFIIFIFILQQIDGNIIGPMILGDSVGLPAFWVIFSLLVFNSIMGFWGMILGVPLFATFYYLIKRLVNHMLTKRDLPVDINTYIHLDNIEDDGEITYLKPEVTKKIKHEKPNDKKPGGPDL